jgi:hypothetical protein
MKPIDWRQRGSDGFGRRDDVQTLAFRKGESYGSRGHFSVRPGNAQARKFITGSPARDVCEARLDHLAKEAKFASSSAERQAINHKIIVAEKYLEVLQDDSFVPEPTPLSGFLWLVKDLVEGYHY